MSLNLSHTDPFESHSHSSINISISLLSALMWVISYMVLVGVKCFVLDTVLDNFFGLHKTSERIAALTTLQNSILKEF